MKKYLLGLFLLSTAMFNITASAAEDNLIILDDSASKPSSSSPILDFLQKSFFVNGGGFWSGAGDKKGLTQAFGFGRVGFDYSFKVLNLNQKVYITGGYSYRQIDLGLVLKEGFGDEGNSRKGNSIGNPCQFASDGAVNKNASRRECNFTISVRDKGFELREAYGSFEIFSDVVLNVGRQRPTWGQFEVFSIVNSILPIEIQSKEFGVSNTNLRMPQDMSELKVFLFESVELSAYVFYQTTLDPLLEKVLSQSEDYDFYTYDDSNDTYSGPDSRQAQGDNGDLINQDKLGFAGRVLWRSDYLTAGFTYNQGYFSLFSSFNRLPMVEAVGPDAFNVVPRLILPKSISYGAEVSVPISNWTIKGEVVYVQNQADIGLRSTGDIATRLFPTEDVRDANRELFDWVVNNNGGRGYVDVNNFIAQIGFSADYQNWAFGLNVLFLTTILSDEAKRANELYKRAYPGDDSILDEGSFDGIPLPTAFVFYNFGNEQQHRVGLVGGFLGIAAGVNVFYTGPLYLGVAALDERINWTASMDYTTSIASRFLSEEQDSRNGDNSGAAVSLASDFALSFRVGATLEF